MSREQFDKALAEAIRDYPAGAHEGWQADFTALNQLPGVVSCKVRKTGDPTALIEANCKLELAEISVSEVAQELERYWTKELVFRAEPEWHILTITTEEIVLEAFTIHGIYYVSARVVLTISGTASA